MNIKIGRLKVEKSLLIENSTIWLIKIIQLQETMNVGKNTEVSSF